MTVAQKILSTVVRIGQSWGVGHVIDVLRGRVTDQITNHRHQELSTFGLLADVPIAELRGYLDQLTEQQLLLRTDGPYPVLQLTDDGVAALKGVWGPSSSIDSRVRPLEGAHAGYRATPRPGTVWTAGFLRPCDSTVPRWPAPGACRPMSSFTTTRCATSRGDDRRQRRNCWRSTGSARGRRRTSARSSSR